MRVKNGTTTILTASTCIVLCRWQDIFLCTCTCEHALNTEATRQVQHFYFPFAVLLSRWQERRGDDSFWSLAFSWLFPKASRPPCTLWGGGSLWRAAASSRGEVGWVIVGPELPTLPVLAFQNLTVSGIFKKLPLCSEHSVWNVISLCLSRTHGTNFLLVAGFQ